MTAIACSVKGTARHVIKAQYLRMRLVSVDVEMK